VENQPSITQFLAELRLGWVILFCLALWLLRLPFRSPKVYKYFTSLEENEKVRVWIASQIEALLFAVALIGFVVRPFLLQAFFIPSGSMLDTLQLQDRLFVDKLSYRFRDPQYGDIVLFQVEQGPMISHFGGQLPGEIPNSDKPPKRTFWGELFGEDYGGDLTAKLFIKRCIGVPGDTISVRDGKLYKNGDRQKKPKPLLEPYIADVDSFATQQRLKGITGTNDPMLLDGPHGGEVYINYEYPSQEQKHAPWVIKGADGHLWAKVQQNCYLMLGDNRNHSNDGHIWGFVHRERVVGRAWLTFWPPNRAGIHTGDWKGATNRNSDPKYFWIWAGGLAVILFGYPYVFKWIGLGKRRPAQ